LSHLLPLALRTYCLLTRRHPGPTLLPTRRSSDLRGQIRGGGRGGTDSYVARRHLVGCRAAAGAVHVESAHLCQRPIRCLGKRRRSEEHTSELQSHLNLVCRLLLETTHTR